MVIFKFIHSDNAAAYLLFDNQEAALFYLRDNYYSVRVYDNEEFVNTLVIMEDEDKMPLRGYIIKPQNLTT